MNSPRYVLRVFEKNPESNSFYNESYSFWKTVWSNTMNELEGVEVINSDAFMTADKVFALFDGFSCIGIGLLHSYNLDNPAHLDHSYFKFFSEKSKTYLKQSFDKVASINHIAVSPDYRRSNIPEFLIREIYKEFLKTDSEALIAFTRNNRKINEVAYRLGAFAVDQNVKNYGVSTDIIFFDRKNFKFGEENGVKDAA